MCTANFRQRNDLVVLAHHPTKTVEATQVTLHSLHSVSRPFTKPMNFIAVNNQRSCGVPTWALQKFTSPTADHPARTFEEILNNLLQPGTNQVCSVSRRHIVKPKTRWKNSWGVAVIQVFLFGNLANCPIGQALQCGRLLGIPQANPTSKSKLPNHWVRLLTHTHARARQFLRVIFFLFDTKLQRGHQVGCRMRNAHEASGPWQRCCWRQKKSN